MADRDTWEKAESVSRIFAEVLIPVVLGLDSRRPRNRGFVCEPNTGKVESQR
jgi:hypothetical protein